MPWYLLILMIFLHIVDDYVLQGILASLKQKMWWINNYPDTKYRYDYIVGLVMHSFSWTFMIMLPFYSLAIANNPAYYILFFWNWFLHGLTDHAKANVGIINLVIDQSIHIAQIVLTFYILSQFI